MSQINTFRSDTCCRVKMLFHSLSYLRRPFLGEETLPLALLCPLNPSSQSSQSELFIGEYGHVTPQLKTFQGLSKALRMKPKVVTGIHSAPNDPLPPLLQPHLPSLCCSSHHDLCCTSSLQPLAFTPAVPSARKAGKTQVIMAFQGSA